MNMTPRWATDRRDSFSTANSQDDAGTTTSDHMDERCEQCWQSTIMGLCTCLACIFCCQNLRTVNRSNRQSRNHRNLSGRTTRRQRRPGLCFPGLLLSFLLFVIISSSSNVTNKLWTLNGGETRGIKMPLLTSSMTITATGGAGLDVYEFVGSKCPPLTGSPVSLQDKWSFTLGLDDYQYDYFFLNKGSAIDVNVIQSVGSTNIYLVKGQKMVDRLEGTINNNNDDDDDDYDMDEGFEHYAKLKRFVSAGSTNHVHLHYDVHKTDAYTIIYDNASTKDGQLTVQYQIQLTTHDTQGQSPICTNVLSNPCTVVHTRKKRASCIVLQAKETTETQEHFAEDVVTIEITGRRRWGYIVGFSLIPFLIQLIRGVFFDQSGGGAEGGTSVYEAVGEIDHPPPSAPYAPAETSATSTTTNQGNVMEPVEARLVDDGTSRNDHSDETIPIVPVENVIPIPVPTEERKGSWWRMSG